jgi:signal transduction histidine kinase
MRMAASHGVVLLLILVALGGVGQALLARSIDRAATNEVLTVAQQAAESVREAGPGAPPPDTDTPSRTGIRVKVFLPSGVPADHDERVPSWLRPRSRTLVEVSARGEPIRVATLRVRRGGRPVAVVVAARSLVSERSLLHHARLLLLFGGMAAVIASMTAGWWLAGRAVRPVRRAYEAQAGFAADASHELRNPLAFIRVGVETLAEETTPAPRRGELGGEVLDEVDHLTMLTERLLMLARADRGKVEMSAEPVDLPTMCRAAIRRVATARGLSAEVRSANGLRALCDPVATAAVLDVVLENAAIHGGGTAEVTCEQDGRRALLSVTDHGPGMSAEALVNAFDPFFRADPARARTGGGPGLGLAIARRLVEAQRGGIQLRPTAGGGVTAVLSLPLAPAEPFDRVG